MQESVLVLLVEVYAFSYPGAHGSHSGWVVVVPAVFVYLPGGHLVWAIRQASVLVLLTDVKALKNPFGHASHSGWKVTKPFTFVYFPGGHFVCTVHLAQPVATAKHIALI